MAYIDEDGNWHFCVHDPAWEWIHPPDPFTQRRRMRQSREALESLSQADLAQMLRRLEIQLELLALEPARPIPPRRVLPLGLRRWWRWGPGRRLRGLRG